jgi:hypothetical protein
MAQPPAARPALGTGCAKDSKFIRPARSFNANRLHGIAKFYADALDHERSMIGAGCHDESVSGM